MKNKRFIWLVALTLYAIFAFTGYALADVHQFYYDSNVSAARNKVAQYAYEILNYEWTTNATIARYKGNPKTTTGVIHGVPYAGNDTFAYYKNQRSSNEKNSVGSYDSNGVPSQMS